MNIPPRFDDVYGLSSNDENRYYENHPEAARRAGFATLPLPPDMFTLRKKDGTFLSRQDTWTKDYTRIQWGLFITMSQAKSKHEDAEIYPAESVIQDLSRLLDMADAKIQELNGNDPDGPRGISGEHSIEEGFI